MFNSQRRSRSSRLLGSDWSLRIEMSSNARFVSRLGQNKIQRSLCPSSEPTHQACRRECPCQMMSAPIPSRTLRKRAIRWHVGGRIANSRQKTDSIPTPQIPKWPPCLSLIALMEPPMIARNGAN